MKQTWGSLWILGSKSSKQEFMDVNYDTGRLLDAMDRFPEVKVLVVGDVMLDVFVWGKVGRISPEAPVPVVDVTKETRLLGGAANVINNIVSAGGRALLAGVIGQDRPARSIIRMVKELGVDPGGLAADPDRPTSVKTRVVAHAQQVVRVDRENKSPLDKNVSGQMLSFLEGAAEEVDAVIVSDYGKGVVTPALMNGIRRIFTGQGKIVAVDPKVNNFKLYRKATVITPNHHEASLGAGLTIDSERALGRAGRKILGDLDCDSVLITRGDQGMTLFEKHGPASHIPTEAREVFDVTGAGDTVIAVLTLGLAAGLSRVEAAVLANFAAGVVVGEVGTSAVTAPKLKSRVKDGALRPE